MFIAMKDFLNKKCLYKKYSLMLCFENLQFFYTSYPCALSTLPVDSECLVPRKKNSYRLRNIVTRTVRVVSKNAKIV